MPTTKTTNKSPCVRNNQQTSLSPMRQFNSNLDQTEGVQSSIGNGLITASPMMNRNSANNTSSTRIGIRSSTKRQESMKNTQQFGTQGYLASLQPRGDLQKTPSKQQVVVVSNGNNQPMYEVYMRCVTWSRDSHGLFDYESKNIAKKNIKTQTGGKILRVSDDVEFVSIRTKPEDFGPTSKPMIIVRQKHGKYPQIIVSHVYFIFR